MFKKAIYTIVASCAVFCLVCIAVGAAAAQDVDSNTVKLPYLCVRGITFDENGAMAIVNDEVVEEGDSIAGGKVLRIESALVQFEFQGVVFEKAPGEGCRRPIQSVVSSNSFSAVVSDGSFTKLMRKATRSKQCGGIGNTQAQKFVTEHISKILIAAWILLIALYIYLSYTLQIIARKTQTENDWLAWIPIGNLYLMCKIADKPAWWLILLFAPFVSILVMVLIYMGIAEARKKPGWLGIFLAVPIVQLFVQGYLAFSNDDDSVPMQEIHPVEIKPAEKAADKKAETKDIKKDTKQDDRDTDDDAGSQKGDDVAPIVPPYNG